MYKKLLDKGFERWIYVDQGNKVFYKKDFLDPEMVLKLFGYFDEDRFFYDDRNGKIYCTLEITEDLSFAQYCFSEINGTNGDMVYDKLSLEEFSKVLDLLDDVEVLESKEF